MVRPGLLVHPVSVGEPHPPWGVCLRFIDPARAMSKPVDPAAESTRWSGRSVCVRVQWGLHCCRVPLENDSKRSYRLNIVVGVVEQIRKIQAKRDIDAAPYTKHTGTKI